ncbi:MAG: hypothetical protein ACE5HN_08015 [Nitrospiria bacterium]
MVLCKRFFFTFAGYGTKEVTEDAFLDDAFWIINRTLHYNYPIDQVFLFQTESENFDEAGFEAAMERFRATIAILKGIFAVSFIARLTLTARPWQAIAWLVRLKTERSQSLKRHDLSLHRCKRACRMG